MALRQEQTLPIYGAAARVPPVQSAIGLLWGLLAASLLVPVALFGIVAWIEYRSSVADAERELLHASEVAREQASKVFESQAQMADRVVELVHGLDAASAHQSERSLHEGFMAIVAKLPQIQSVVLAARDGQVLVSAGAYPVPPNLKVSNTDYFQAVIGGTEGTYVSSLQKGGINGRPFFGLARPWIGSDGQLAGVIDIALSPGFFRDFYKILVGEGDSAAGANVVTLMRDDGRILARSQAHPAPQSAGWSGRKFQAAVAENPDHGLFGAPPVPESGNAGRIYAYRKVQGYPVYVLAGRDRRLIIADWWATISNDLLFGVPVTLALFAVTWMALLRTRREERALAQAHREIARREAAEAALLRSQRLEAVGQMTGGVAHDFNNLLTVVLGGSRLLGKRAENPQQVRDIAEQMTLAAQRGGEIIQQLLAFSRRQTVNPELICVNRSLREFRPLLEHAASEAVRVEMSLTDTHETRLVLVDPGQFEAAILNLVGNARDAMPHGGLIVITTETQPLNPAAHPELVPGDYVRVTVTDTGSGMDPQTAARAFEPFFTTKEVGRGTGLGLSQVYGFSRQAGGDVRISSRIGVGTTIEILLPLASGATADPPPRGSSAPRRSEGEVVLVVEDQPGVLDMAVESLRDLGYCTISAPTPQAALDRLAESGRIDVMFSDVVMPGMSGMELAAAARRLRPSLRVLLTSGYTGRSEPQEGLLPKPYDQNQLAARLRAVLEA